jgi:excisionase family DNA binding protein
MGSMSNPSAHIHRKCGLAELVAQWNRALTVAELAELLSISQQNIYLKVRAGLIPYLRIGGCIRFDPKATADWLRASTSSSNIAA